MSKAGYGYYLLGKGETLLPTDDFLMDGKWVPTTMAESKVGGLVAGIRYRRKIDVGAGWELVPEGAKILEGDEYYSEADSSWCKSGNSAFDAVVGDSRSPFVYRRKKAEANMNDKVVVGEGYRLLVNGEQLLHDDEVCCPDGKTWLKTSYAGYRVGAGSEVVGPYRRKLSVAPESKVEGESLEKLVKAARHFLSTYESGYLAHPLSDSLAFDQLKNCVKALSQE